jgi:hypothetical protein
MRAGVDPARRTGGFPPLRGLGYSFGTKSRAAEFMQ